MEEDQPLLEINTENKNYLRVYTYSYSDEMRFTVSFENDDSVISSEHLKPVFCPFTGKRISNSSEDMNKLASGISLKSNNGKLFKKCCYIDGRMLHLAALGSHMQYEFEYDPLTGKSKHPVKTVIHRKNEQGTMLS